VRDIVDNIEREKNMMFAANFRMMVASLAFAAFALTATASFAEDAKIPTTVAEHEALAKQYKDQATQYKKVADDHRAMAAAYSTVHQPSNGPTANAGGVKMKKHCEAIAKDADKLASDTERAADFHTLRAKELQGK
jgi:hypothetical protein